MVVRAAGTGVEHDATVGKTVTVASSRVALRSKCSASLPSFRVSLRCFKPDKIPLEITRLIL